MNQTRAKRALLTELHNVLTLLRQNQRFLHRVPSSMPIYVSVGIPLAPSNQEEIVFESRLIKELKELRDATRAMTDREFDSFSRVAVVQPFLAVIRSPEASGPFTDAALMALITFLRTGLMTEHSVHCAEALGELVDAVIGCRFEETDAARDEAVKSRMLRVLVTALESPAGKMLTDTAVWDMVQTCFVNRNEVVHTAMLCHSAEEALHTIVRTTFMQLSETLEQSPVSTRSKRSDWTPPPSSTRSNASEVPEIGGYGLPCCVKVFGFLCSNLLRVPAESSSAVTKAHQASLQVLCLRLVRVVADTTGEALCRCPPLLCMVRDDLSHALLRMARTPGGSLEVLSESLGVMRCLWGVGRQHLKMQFQALFNGIFLRALAQMKHNSEQAEMESEDSASSLPQWKAEDLYNEREQEVVLEAMCDFLAEASLLPDLYVNYDCDLQSADILESLFVLLSDCARLMPTGATSELCLEALLSAMRGLYRRTGNAEQAGGDDTSQHQVTEHSPQWDKKLRKRVLRQGALEFNKKPKKGLMFLQEQQMLSDPLTPEAVAQFLRTAPGLEKQIIGEYLGSMGKPDVDPESGEETYIGDTEGFHEQVLQAFVQSFDFRGQPLLDAMRMYLAAFRLPGEAQQIDRVLQAFANEAHLHCQESQTGIFATPDVCFLLSFSLVMLQTDLHNANIKPEKRMTLEQFMMQNRNYGVDISKGQDLPVDLMETMYNSIKELPISTEGDGPNGQITIDRWRDLMRQAEANDSLSMMTIHSDDYYSGFDSSRGPKFQESTLYDRDILSLVWQPIMWAASHPFSLGAGRREENLSYRFSTGFLRQSVDVILLLSKVLGHHHMHDAFDSLVYLLCNFTGLLKSSPPVPEGVQQSEVLGETEQTEMELSILLYDFCLSPIAQMATVTVFGIVDRLGNHLRQGWRPVIRLLLQMRDLHILPKQCLRESDSDLLSPDARMEFNASVLAAMGVTKVKSRASKRQSGTGFFGWLRGDSQESQEGSYALAEMWDETYPDSEPDAKEPEASRSSQGEDVVSKVIDSSMLTTGPATMPTPKIGLTEETVRNLSPAPDLPYESFFENPAHARIIARRCLSLCNVTEVVSGSRFLSQRGLLYLAATLVATIHTNLPEAENSGIAGKEEDWDKEFPCPGADEDVQEPKGKVFNLDLPRVSRASLAYAEVLLMEVSLRNRDRLNTLWPMLAVHYRQRLNRARTLSFAVEKAATGLLRLTTRLMSRESMAQTFSEALAWLSPPNMNCKVATLLGPLLGSGVWHVVTANTGILTKLTPKGWKAIFDLISTCAPIGGEGAAKAFEALCFLAHEPQLQACVPITCISAVSSFVSSSRVQPSLSIAALDLLMVMHFRLEVLFNKQDGDSEKQAQDCKEKTEEKPKSKKENVLPQCWVPLLKAMSLGGKDSRSEVQEHALRLLIQATADAHATHISPLLLLQIIQNILVPLAKFVCQESDGSASPERRPNRAGSFTDWFFRPTSDSVEDLMPSPMSPTTPASPTTTPSLVSIKEEMALSSDRVSSQEDYSPTFGRNQILCLTLLCKVFLTHLNSLLPLPSFHELWLKILQVTQIYLGKERSAIAESLVGAETTFSSVAETALEHLKNILLVMHTNGAFQPGDDTIGQELWELTWAVLENFHFCPNLMADLFPGTNRHSPVPVSPVAPDSFQIEDSNAPPPDSPALQASEPSKPEDRNGCDIACETKVVGDDHMPVDSQQKM